MKEMTAQKAQARLEEMCAKAEHCEHELHLKLIAWGIPPQAQAQILADMRARRFYDDERFAAAYARDKAKFARWGRRKIAQALRLKRIDRQTVADALDQIDEGEYRETLADIIRAKMRQRPGLADTYEGRTKLFRFAVGRGFEPDLVSAALKTVIAAQS